jgi:acyl carrier protein
LASILAEKRKQPSNNCDLSRLCGDHSPHASFIWAIFDKRHLRVDPRFAAGSWSFRRAEAAVWGQQAVMTFEELEMSVSSLICQRLNIKASRIVPGAHFMDDLGADSVDVVELLMDFQDALGVTIPDGDAEGLATVGDAIAYLANGLGLADRIV